VRGLAVLLAANGVFALGWIVAQYAKRIHAAGSLYDYVSREEVLQLQRVG
jgi:amino acid transporter